MYLSVSDTEDRTIFTLSPFPSTGHDLPLFHLVCERFRLLYLYLFVFHNTDTFSFLPSLVLTLSVTFIRTIITQFFLLLQINKLFQIRRRYLSPLHQPALYQCTEEVFGPPVLQRTSRVSFVLVVSLVHQQISYFNTHDLQPIWRKRGPTRFLLFFIYCHG